MHRTTKRILISLLAAGFAIAGPVQAWAEAAKIVLDPGHGGSDPGAVGVNGIYEKDVNLDVAVRLRDELARRGYDVVLTRTSDVFLTLAERVEMTDRIKPDIFISVHANSYKDSRSKGSMVLYYDKDYPQTDYPASEAMAALTPESKELAQDVLTAMVKEAGTVNKGLVPSAVYVARMGSVPSILVETGFLSNPEEAGQLADTSFRQKLADGIADGVAAYLPADKPEGAFRDVPAGHWANSAILKLKVKGILEGEYGYFYPNRALTRAEFVTMLSRGFDFPAAGTASGCTAGSASGSESGSSSASGCTAPASKTPSDLTTSHWAYTALKKAVDSGILEGYLDGTIKPDSSLTRGEAAAMIDRLIFPGGSQTASSTIFSDVPNYLWSAAAINRLKAKGIIDGVTETTFDPNRLITRAEMSALLSRLIH